MKFAVIVFPGSNCDVDLMWAIKDIMGAEAEYVRHDAESLAGFDGVLLPGGFSYGDYLRCGAIARFSAIMSEVIRLANEGKPVFGTCNGFQILTEAGLLPGVLQRNESLHFICKPVRLQVNNQTALLLNMKRIKSLRFLSLMVRAIIIVMKRLIRNWLPTIKSFSVMKITSTAVYTISLVSATKQAMF